MARHDRGPHNRVVNLPINVIDLAAVATMVVFAYLGWRSGALPQVLGLAGAGAGIVVVVLGAPLLVDLLGGLDPFLRAVLAVGGAFFLVALAEAIGSSVGVLFSERLGRGIVGSLDSIVGAMFGVGQALLLAWLVGGMLAAGPVPLLAREAQRSAAVRGLMTVLPPPSEVVGQLTAIIDASGLPQVFSGLEPAPAPAVDTPATAEARRIAAGARDSVVRVDSTACNRRFTGTGFSIGAGYVLTNAHVVAGASHVTVTADLTGAHVDGTVVAYDPEMDLAVLWTPGLQLPALRFAASTPKRGTIGAALGHPNANPLAVIPAAVSASLKARGRDIYGDHIVTRQVLELRAAVEPGDSGGPLMLADGTVGGVVFAEARSDPDVGYALDPVAVSAAVMPDLQHAKVADLGACIR